MAIDCLFETNTIACLRESVDCSSQELQQIFQERYPYVIGETITGECLVWDESFISLCRYAMSTDCIDGMSAEEKRIWKNFVSYEDLYSTSPDVEMCGGMAIGCTVPDENGKSYAVCSDGTISTEECLPAMPDGSIPKDYVYHDLDQLFMKLVNCEEYNDCGCEGIVPLDVGDCEQCGPDYPTCTPDPIMP